MVSASSRCTVAILNYNGEKWLRQFLPAVIEHSPDAHILIYDNASVDGSIAYVCGAHPQVELISGPDNLGFCAGYNRAFDHIHTEFAVLLNSDVEVTSGWLENLLEPFSDPKVGAIQPKVRSWHERDKFEYAGAAGGFLDRFGYPYCRGRVFDTVEVDNGQYDDACDIDWATGACIAVRTSLYKQLGGLDERFFAHMEEIDWCFRARRAGYAVRYAPQSLIYHVGGGTLAYNSPRKLFLNYRNGLLMLDNNLQGFEHRFTLLARLVLDGVSALYLAMSGNRAAIGTILDAHFAFYELRDLGRKQNLPVPISLGKRFLVWDYFVEGRKRFSDLA